MTKVAIALPEQQLVPGQVQKKLEFRFDQPVFLAILGRNGSGKSTLLKAMMSLLPFQGEIFFSHAPAFLPQHMPKPWGLTASEVVAMGAYFESEWRTEANFAQAAAILEKWELEHLKERDLAVLSGGERQLIWLSQMEQQNSEIMLLDEPTQYLDIYYQARVFDWMSTLVEKGKTIICVTHQLEYVKRMKGYLLNLSEEHPQLRAISSETLDVVRARLERQK